MIQFLTYHYLHIFTILSSYFNHRVLIDIFFAIALLYISKQSEIMFFITVKILKNTEMGGYILSDIIILIRSNFGVMVKNIYS